MTSPRTRAPSLELSVGIALRPIAGELVSGDACANISWSRGALVAVVDGLGHGEHAAAAARTFVESIRASREHELAALFERAHLALLRTRGAVASVARFDIGAEKVELGCVGNVTTLMLPASGGRTVHPLSFPGVLGSAYRSFRSQSFDFGAGDTMVMHSDGVRSRFDVGALRVMSAQVAADVILGVAAKSSDDAACLVARGCAAQATDVPVAAAPSAPFESAPSLLIPLRSAGDAAYAALQVRSFARRIGLATRAQWEVSIAASELATNVLKFAGSGTLRMSHVIVPLPALVLDVADRGRGIGDLRAAVVDGWSEGSLLTPDRAATARGLGVGLGSVYRMMDVVDVQTAVGQGTRVIATKYMGCSGAHSASVA